MTASDTDRADPEALAARYGLMEATARPSLPEYIRRLWARRYFILAYASARSTSKYSSALLGQLWQVITPLLQAAIYYLLFGLLLGLSRGVENYPAFLITGVFVFGFLTRSLNNGAKSISSRRSMIRTLHFPRAVLPLSFVLVEFRQLLISMVVLFGVVLVTGEPLTVKWLLVPPAMILQTLFNLGLGLTWARIGAGAQDVNQLLPFLTRIWFYSSGVFFSIDQRLGNLPGPMHPIIQLNPGAIFLDLYRSVLLDSYEPMQLSFGLNAWVVAAFWSVLLLVGGFIFFWQREETYGRG